MTTKGECIKLAKTIASKYDDLVSQTPHNVAMAHLFMRKATRVDDVSKNVKRKIIQQARDEAKSSQLNQDFVALYSSTQSEKQWDAQRIDSYRATRPSRPRDHVGKLTNYQWNQNLILDILCKTDGKIDNWSQLASKISIISKKTNEIPKNAGQVSLSIIII